LPGSADGFAAAFREEAMPHHANDLLRRLTPAALARVIPHLSVVDLASNQVLAITHGAVARVYFPHGGVISCVVQLVGGGAIETGMIGKDGVFGASQALDDQVSLNHVTVQIAGTASVIAANRLPELARELPEFRKLLMAYDQFFVAQVQQTAACNAVHDIEARTCKWLSRMYELVGADFELTQEFLAQMMGVRRTSVTTVASALQAAGLISYSRGRLHIMDIDRIRHRACECDGDIRSHYRRMFQPDMIGLDSPR
jgi:CRP-like cAMP-binding protein